MIVQVPEDSSNTEGVGARLKRLRIQRGLSQRDLSSPGVSYAYISRIEAGARTPSVKALRKLSQKLGVSVEYLETGRDIREVDDRELKLSDAELQLRLESDTGAAEKLLEEVLAEASSAGDRTSAGRAAIGLGLAAANRGNHLDAVERLEAALEYERVPPQLRPDVYSQLGRSYAALGAADRAARLFEQCLAEVAEATPEDVTLQVRYATYLSYALSDAGDYVRAVDVVRDALSRAGESVDGYSRVRLYWSLARVAAIEGRSAEALTQIRRAMALLEVDRQHAAACARISPLGRHRVPGRASRRDPGTTRDRRETPRPCTGPGRPRHAAHRPVPPGLPRRRRRRGGRARTGRARDPRRPSWGRAGRSVLGTRARPRAQGRCQRCRRHLPPRGRPPDRSRAAIQRGAGFTRLGHRPAGAGPWR